MLSACHKVLILKYLHYHTFFTTTPIIYANLNKIDMELREANEYYFYQEKGSTITQKQYIEKRKKEFLQHYQEISWLSWNITSAETYQILK